MNLKNFIAISTALLFVSSGQLWSQQQSPVEDSLKNFDRMLSTLKISSVIGKPIRQGNIVIIPFARISFGLGAGGAMMGFGGGMGGKAVPTGLLIIEGEDVRVEIFPLEEEKPSLFQQMLPVLIEYLPQILSKKFLPKPRSTPEKTQEKPKKSGEKKSLSQVKKLYNEKKYLEALEAIDPLIAEDSNNAELHAWNGIIMGNLAEGNPVNMMKYGMGAMEEFEKAVELDPNNALAHFGRGVGRLMAPEGFGGDVDGAIEDLEFSCKKDPYPESYYYLGMAYQKKGLSGKAKEAYKKALELKPDYQEAAEALAEIK